MQTRVPAPVEANKQQSHNAQHPAQLLVEQQGVFEDHSPQAAQLTSLQAMMRNSPSQLLTQAIQAKMNGSAQTQQMRTLKASMASGDVAQREELEEPLQAQVDGGAVPREEVAAPSKASNPNNTGLPDNLKSGIESLSGMSMDHVKVHYNSSQPAQLNALAYAQGSEIHVAPGQEQHVPHEAWHVVQQAQGRVKPTMQMKAGVAVNDDVDLEAEADVMGAKALGLGAVQRKSESDLGMFASPPSSRNGIVQPKIRFRNGVEFSKRLDLKGTLSNSQRRQGIWEDRVKSSKTYLAESPVELRKYADRTGGALLTPHRHLIGENHDESQFTAALAKWGWGADKMAESYNESSVVTDKITKGNQEFKGRAGGYITSNPYYQTKPLEKFHPYIVQGLSMLRFSLTELRRAVRLMQNQASNIVFAPNDVRRQQFAGSEVAVVGYRTESKDLWSQYIKIHIASYQESCTTRIQTPRGLGNLPADCLYDMAIAMAPLWATLDTRMNTITSKPYWRTSNWIATSEALANQDQQITTFIQNVIDVWMDHLVLMTKAEATETTGNTRHNNVIEQSLAAGRGAAGADVAVRGIGPMREIFMAYNINNNLNLPGLVKIGAEHVTNLRGRIADGKYYGNYAEFLAATES